MDTRTSIRSTPKGLQWNPHTASWFFKEPPPRCCCLQQPSCQRNVQLRINKFETLNMTHLSTSWSSACLPAREEMMKMGIIRTVEVPTSNKDDCGTRRCTRQVVDWLTKYPRPKLASNWNTDNEISIFLSSCWGVSHSPFHVQKEPALKNMQLIYVLGKWHFSSLTGLLTF